MEKNNEEGLSILVCSVRPERLAALGKNIAATIGKKERYELLSHDNRKSGWPLAKAYNHLAYRARYSHLLFIHEDVSFESHDWYREVREKLKEEDCGVIGFAGAVIMPQAPGGWAQTEKYNRLNLKERGVEYRVNIDEEKAFSEVVTLDGFAMFVRRNVWAAFPFDEKHLKGFHCYDVDFTLGMGTRYRHYVSHHISIIHDSSGIFGNDWVEATIDIYLRKWKYLLPRQISSLRLGEKLMEAEGERVLFRTLRKLKDLGISSKEITIEFFYRRNSLRHIGHIIKWMIAQARR